jgi:hypothetical protein
MASDKRKDHEKKKKSERNEKESGTLSSIGSGFEKMKE